MAAQINQSPNPMVITDASAVYTLALSSHLRNDISLLLVNEPSLQPTPSLDIDQMIQEPFISDVFLFAPSPPLQEAVKINLPIEMMETVVQQSDRFQLLRLIGPRKNTVKAHSTKKMYAQTS
ncbi:MAG: hypothetical protein F6K16_38500 [Symploca sp. SIO2B6]|nr:hypothetical protein [Symploca sp. SIO2B6]